MSPGGPPWGRGPATYRRRIPHRCAILTPMRTVVLFAVVIAVGAAIGIGLKQATSGDGAGVGAGGAAADRAGDGGRARRRRRPPLAALHAQANELLPGAAARAARASSRRCKGHPAVVNVWASWCGPCRTEMPALQRVALSRGRDGRVPRREPQGQPRGGAAVPDDRPAELPELRGPGRADLQRLRARRRAVDDLLRRRRAARSSPTRARTRRPRTSRRTSIATRREDGGRLVTADGPPRGRAGRGRRGARAARGRVRRRAGRPARGGARRARRRGAAPRRRRRATAPSSAPAGCSPTARV